MIVQKVKIINKIMEKVKVTKCKDKVDLRGKNRDFLYRSIQNLTFKLPSIKESGEINTLR